jgi:hypothetical protein
VFIFPSSYNADATTVLVLLAISLFTFNTDAMLKNTAYGFKNKGEEMLTHIILVTYINTYVGVKKGGN